jgi:hypothetical protein
MPRATPAQSSSTPDPAAARFRRTLTRVLIVQLVSMIVLGLIQVYYNR